MATHFQETLTLDEESAGLRLDRWLASHFPEYSRTYFQYLIDSKAVNINGKEVKKRTLLNAGDEVLVNFIKSPEIELKPQNIPLDILYEDEHLIAVNKPVGMVVHPAPGHPDQTLVNALLHHCQNLPGSDLRPGIVHRLDKETSGVMIAAKSAIAHQKLSEIFSRRLIEKIYIAIALGRPSMNVIDAPIGRHAINRKMMCVRTHGGKAAQTEIDVLAFKEGFSLLKIRLHTGRTHQIRVHLKSVNTPLVGDPVYGVMRPGAERPLLHAHQLILDHPLTDQKLVLTSPIPSDIAVWVEKLGSEIKIL
jgi:23S rRNA pseudouridine1911/1915/1917 synthase